MAETLYVKGYQTAPETDSALRGRHLKASGEETASGRWYDAAARQTYGDLLFLKNH
jgi:hypothetical protein